MQICSVSARHSDMEITFAHYAGDSANGIVAPVVVPLYEASYEAELSDPFFSADRFVERLQNYMLAPGFSLAIAYHGDEPVGQAFGYPLPPESRWWEDMTPPPPPAYTAETGSRTFALNELMGTPTWQGRGVAHALHDSVLAARGEARATLLVRTDNASARTAYSRWGWRQVGMLQPFPDSPNLEVMVLPLPLPL